MILEDYHTDKSCSTTKLTWILVGQGYIVLVVGAGQVDLDIFSIVCIINHYVSYFLK